MKSHDPGYGAFRAGSFAVASGLNAGDRSSDSPKIVTAVVGWSTDGSTSRFNEGFSVGMAAKRLDSFGIYRYLSAQSKSAGRVSDGKLEIDQQHLPL